MISSNKPESCFVKRVNTHEGFWYHSWQEHDPSLTLSNQIKWQDITSPPWSSFSQWLWRPSSKKPESHFVKKVYTHKGRWYHSWQDCDPSLKLSNQIKWQYITSPPWFCFPQWLWRPSSKKPESHFDKRVNTHEGCWYHSWQDHDPSLILSNQIKWQDVTPSPDSVSRNDYEGPQAKNLNLILTKESTAMRDVGTTVDKTKIPV